MKIIFSLRESMKQNTYFKYLVHYHSSSRKKYMGNWKKSCNNILSSWWPSHANFFLSWSWV